MRLELWDPELPEGMADRFNAKPLLRNRVADWIVANTPERLPEADDRRVYVQEAGYLRMDVLPSLRVKAELFQGKSAHAFDQMRRDPEFQARLAGKVEEWGPGKRVVGYRRVA